MKNLRILLVLTAILLLAGCSSVTVTNDYDHEYNFTQAKTFQWATEAQNIISPDIASATFQNQLNEKRFKDAVNSQLVARGMNRDTTAPELYVAYHTGTQQKTQVTNYGYGYGYGRWGGGNYDVSTYTQGTIILDFIDAKTKTLVWRSVASGAMSSNPDPSKAGQIISDVVGQMLKDFPPKAGK